MTDLADELTEADLAGMWVSRPSRSAVPVPWFAVYWADGGASDLGDLLLLCQWRHRGVHEDGFVLRSVPDRPGRWVFHRPDGIPVLDAAASVPVSVGASERVFDSDGLRPGRYGEPFSLRDSVDVFCRNQVA